MRPCVPDEIEDYSVIGAAHIASGHKAFPAFTTQMVREFGDAIRPSLPKIFEKSTILHDQTARTFTATHAVLTPEERMARGLEGDKKRIRTMTERVQEKTAAGDFTKPERKPPRMDAEKARLMFEYAKAKEQFNKGLLDAQLRKQSVPRKLLRYGGELLNTTRALMTSFDLSAVLRQGGFITFGHPLRALQAFPDMLRALRSEQAQFRVMEDIKNRPNAPLYAQSKLYISDNGPMASLSRMEEAYMSRWAKKIPGVGASERAYTTFLNRLRADSFDAMAANLGKRGKVTAEEAKAIANFVNVATGRGNLDAAAKAAVGLNTVFFAPRYVVSRFQLLAGQPLYRGTMRTRIAIAGEYARMLAGAGIVYALAQKSGATIETDPRSSDFGKIRFGDTRIDPLFGLSQVTTLLSRLATGETKNAGGKIIPIRGPNVPFGHDNAADVTMRFLRTKLAPIPGAAFDISSGQNVVGQKVTPRSAATQLVTPLSIGDIANAMKEQGVPRGTALAILALFGMGVQHYQARRPAKESPR